MRELDVHEVARGVRSGGRRSPVRARRRAVRPAVCAEGRHPDAPASVAVAARPLRVVRAVPDAEPGPRRGPARSGGSGGGAASGTPGGAAGLDGPGGAGSGAGGASRRVAEGDDRFAPAGAYCRGSGAHVGSAGRPAAALRGARARSWAVRGASPGGPDRPAGLRRGGPLPVADAPAVRRVRAVRPASRRCLVPVSRRRARSGARPRGERLLAGAAAVLCSATVVLLLGLLGDAAAGWNAGSGAPPESATVTQVVDR